MSTFQKDDGTPRTGIYHSDLCFYTQYEAKPIVLTAHPRNSRYPGKPSYVKLRVPPDPHEYQLSIEHAGIEQVLAQLPLNVPINVMALGSREAAALQVVGAAPAAHTPQQPQGPVPQAPTRQEQEHSQPPLTHAYYHAFMAANRVATKILQDCGDTYARITPGERLEFARNIATSFFIAHQQHPDRALTGNGQKPKPTPPPPPPPPPPQPAAARSPSPFDDDDDNDDLPF